MADVYEAAMMSQEWRQDTDEDAKSCARTAHSRISGALYLQATCAKFQWPPFGCGNGMWKSTGMPPSSTKKRTVAVAPYCVASWSGCCIALRNSHGTDGSA